MWKWIWPSVGAVPINQGLDTEMFDRTDYPYSETFVREAIQNTLDARLDPSKPVIISFSFHRGRLAGRRQFLESLSGYRAKAKLGWPDDWHRDQITWLVVEDFNSRGLGGDLTSRTSDFWNYWLNFGLSNKDGSGRGGRGIGRVTFLIASQIQTVIGLTRRSADKSVAACGMAVLRAQMDGARFLSTHAYLAENTQESIYALHGTPEFLNALETAFELKGYDGEYSSGFALVVPYPHEELKPSGILAASIEHFAPAIMNGSLIVNVDERTLSADTIRDIAPEVSDAIRAEPIRRNVSRYLDLIDHALGAQLITLPVASPYPAFEGMRDSEVVKQLQLDLLKSMPVGIRLEFPLRHRGSVHTVNLRAVLWRASADRQPIDRLFREGMSLPDVKAKMPGELDMIVLADDRLLATYLNFCEGKAHLDLLQSKDTKAKLKESGFETNFVVKRFVKSLPVELRSLLTPQMIEPDSTVFDEFLSIPNEDKGTGLGRRKRSQEDTEQETITPIPAPKPPAFIVETLSGGFRLRANRKFDRWPVNVSIAVAYADGSRSPSWSEYDFRLENLSVDGSGCQLDYEKNRIQAKNCGPESRIEVTGFDSRRELDTRLKVWSHAA